MNIMKHAELVVESYFFRKIKYTSNFTSWLEMIAIQCNILLVAGFVMHAYVVGQTKPVTIIALNCC